MFLRRNQRATATQREKVKLDGMMAAILC